jgi:hypothetical protein
VITVRAASRVDVRQRGLQGVGEAGHLGAEQVLERGPLGAVDQLLAVDALAGERGLQVVEDRAGVPVDVQPERDVGEPVADGAVDGPVEPQRSPPSRIFSITIQGARRRGGGAARSTRPGP